MAEAVQTGDQLTALRTLATKLGDDLDDETRPAHTTAPLARELAKVLQIIADLEQADPGESMADALAAARRSRLARKAAGQ